MRKRIVLFTSLFLLSLYAAPSWAVQVHGPPEGLYAHILGHLIFIASLVFLLYKTKGQVRKGRKCWFYLRISLFLFLLWNIDTLIVHFLELEIPPEHLVISSDVFKHQLLGPLTWKRWAYYVGRFDHLFCVPAMWFMLQSLIFFYKETQFDNHSSKS